MVCQWWCMMLTARLSRRGNIISLVCMSVCKSVCVLTAELLDLRPWFFAWGLALTPISMGLKVKVKHGNCVFLTSIRKGQRSGQGRHGQGQRSRSNVKVSIRKGGQISRSRVKFIIRRSQVKVMKVKVSQGQSCGDIYLIDSREVRQAGVFSYIMQWPYKKDVALLIIHHLLHNHWLTCPKGIH